MFDVVIDVNGTIKSVMTGNPFKNGFKSYDHKSLVFVRKFARHFANLADENVNGNDWAVKLVSIANRRPAPKIVERKAPKDASEFTFPVLNTANEIVKATVDGLADGSLVDPLDVSARFSRAANFLELTLMLRQNQAVGARHFVATFSDEDKAALPAAMFDCIAPKTPARKVVEALIDPADEADAAVEETAETVETAAVEDAAVEAPFAPVAIDEIAVAA